MKFVLRRFSAVFASLSSAALLAPHTPDGSHDNDGRIFSSLPMRGSLSAGLCTAPEPLPRTHGSFLVDAGAGNRRSCKSSGCSLSACRVRTNSDRTGSVSSQFSWQAPRSRRHPPSATAGFIEDSLRQGYAKAGGWFLRKVTSGYDWLSFR